MKLFLGLFTIGFFSSISLAANYPVGLKCFEIADKIQKEACQKQTNKDIQEKGYAAYKAYKKSKSDKKRRAMKDELQAHIDLIESYIAQLKKEKANYVGILNRIKKSKKKKKRTKGDLEKVLGL